MCTPGSAHNHVSHWILNQFELLGAFGPGKDVTGAQPAVVQRPSWSSWPQLLPVPQIGVVSPGGPPDYVLGLFDRVPYFPRWQFSMD